MRRELWGWEIGRYQYACLFWEIPGGRHVYEKRGGDCPMKVELTQLLSQILDIPGVNGLREGRRRRLLNVLLLAAFLGAIFTMVLTFAAGLSNLGSSRVELWGLLAGTVGVSFGCIALYVLNRHAPVELTGTLFLLVFIGLAAVSDEPEQLVGGRGLLTFAVPILVASALIRAWASFAAASACAAAVTVVSQGVLRQPMAPVPAIVIFYMLALVAWLSSRSLERALEGQRRSTERAQRLADVLRAIRDVNQLIIREKDRHRLLEGVCDTLVETPGFGSAWAVAFDEKGKVTNAAGTNLREGAVSSLQEGGLPVCAQRSLAKSGIVLTDELDICSACLLIGSCGDNVGMTARLEDDGEVLGLLSVSLPAEMGNDKEMEALFDEIAGDIGFALAAMRLEEEHSRTADALRESERRYRELFETSRDGFVILDKDGRFLEANQAYCEMLGYTLDELREMPAGFYDITPERWHDWQREEIVAERLLKAGYSGLYEKEYIRKDGSVFPVEVQAYAFFAGDELAYLWATVRDISERKRMEEELRHQERLAAVGELGAGIAHDFRNLLATILLYAQMDVVKPDVPSDVVDDLQIIITEARKANEWLH